MKEKKIPRLTIATGDDSFAMDLSKDNYLKSIRAAHGQCVVELFDPSTERIGAFLSRAMIASLFSEIRVFCVLHAQSLTEGDLAELDKTLDYEIPDVYMFVSAEIEKKSTAETKINKVLQLKRRGGDESISVQNHAKPYDSKLAGWIAEKVPQLYGRQIGKAEAELLAEMVEYDFIYSELQKIDMALPPGARIDEKVIREIIGATRTMTVYELAAALGKRDLVTALAVVDSLFTGDFYAPLVASAVFKHFWSLLKIKKCLEKNPGLLRQYNSRGGFGKDSPQSQAALEIGIACGMLTEKDRAGNRAYPVMILSGVVDQSQSFALPHLRKILKTLQRFDVDVKTGKVEASLLNVQMLCYEILFSR